VIDNINSFKHLVLLSKELSQLRLSFEYQAQVNKNNELLTTIENDWKAFKMAFNESVKNRKKNLTINEKNKPEFDIEKIDTKIEILDIEIKKTKKIIELEYNTKNANFNIFYN
jgi:hypothetical protein